jgi:hypothetical protein
MSSAGEEVVAWSDDLRTGAVVQHRGLAGGSLAGYLALLTIFSHAPPRVIDAPTVLEMRETYAAYIDAPSSDVAAPAWIVEPLPQQTWWPLPENDVWELLRFYIHERSPAIGCRVGEVRSRELPCMERATGCVLHVPSARKDQVHIVGGLSSEHIRRTVRRNLNQVRFCYEQALQTKPDLQGRVAVRFIIGPTGAVQVSVVESSDLGDRKAEACITSAVGRWNFAAPEGSGIVSVTYPFVLEQVGQ